MLHRNISSVTYAWRHTDALEKTLIWRSLGSSCWARSRCGSCTRSTREP